MGEEIQTSLSEAMSSVSMHISMQFSPPDCLETLTPILLFYGKPEKIELKGQNFSLIKGGRKLKL